MKFLNRILTFATILTFFLEFMLSGHSQVTYELKPIDVCKLSCQDRRDTKPAQKKERCSRCCSTYTRKVALEGECIQIGNFRNKSPQECQCKMRVMTKKNSIRQRSLKKTRSIAYGRRW